VKPDLNAAAVEAFAAEAHNAWRRQLLKDNPAQRGQPRLRMREGEMVDINQPWKSLHPHAQLDNRQAARDALEAVRKFPADREAAAAHVHKLWIKRNKGDPNQPAALMKSYASLPEAEKDKDREHVDRMRALLRVGRPERKSKGAAKGGVKKTARKPAARKRLPSPASKQKTLRLSAAQWERLEALAAQMSAMQGRRVSAEDAGQAALAAMLGVFEVVGLSRPRK
jgi:hypothetical protein